MQIAVFGGAFDPPHIGHYKIATFLLDSQLCHQVWFLPVAQHAFGKNLSGATHRLKMLELLIQGQPHMKIEPYELEKTEGINQTYQTMCSLAREYPAYTFSFVMGSDNLAKFHLWGEYHKLYTEFPVFVYPRKGFSFQPLYPGMIALENAPIVTTSSTHIRDSIARGTAFSAFSEQMSPKVAEYIKDQHLYVTHS